MERALQYVLSSLRTSRNILTRLYRLYQLFPNLVLAVIMESDWATMCFEDKISCQQNPTNPDGIPVWKIFSFHFWWHPVSPLGPRWTLSPENYTAEALGTNTYLGYSVEASCMTHKFLPHKERPEGQAYIMAKRLSYFAPQDQRAWPLEFYDEAAAVTGVRFVAGAEDDSEERGHELGVPKELPSCISNYGLLPQQQFVDAIAHSRLLIGVGHPKLFVATSDPDRLN